ncbi:MAG TPA: hypothetical protein VH414_01200 [Lichenihabitans sp.]|jgi:hypothetical protein|nr:hypothetical protein [Lichenihabitans sp.]
MCEVCAIFGAGEHWSDFGRLRDEQFPFADIQHTRAQRKRRIALLNRLLSTLGLSCEEWDGESLVILDGRGRSNLAPTLSDVWSAAERLSGRAIDPLDPVFLEAVVHA